MDNQLQQQLATETSNHIENPNSVLRFIRQPSSTPTNAMIQKSAAVNSGSTNNNGSTAGRRPTYAQWISKAIASSPTKALTLADINEWMIRHVPGLQEQRYLHSCKGWKNAVRHTLSINRHRFKKVARDGKPSLWCLINEDESLCTTATTTTTSTVVNGNEESVALLPASSPDDHRKMSPNAVVKQQQNDDNRSSSENSTSTDLPLPKSASTKRTQSDLLATEGVEVRMKVARMNSEPSMPQQQQHQPAANTQTLDVLYADGVLGKIILPMPLPISGLNFGGLLLNSAAAAVNPVQQQCHWPPLNASSSNLAFLQQMLKLSSTSPNNNNNNTSNLLWDLFGMNDIAKNKSFVA